jgi:hypothetical protein
MFTRVNNHAHNNPTASPKVAVANPLKVNPFIRDSANINKPATAVPPTKPMPTETSKLVFLVLSAMAIPAIAHMSKYKTRVTLTDDVDER